jgi:hypothetical protein
VRRNPLLAIVGNPQERDVHPLAFEARDRYREDMEAGHTSAAEYWRGQAGAFFTMNPPELGYHVNQAKGMVNRALAYDDRHALHQAHAHLRRAYQLRRNPAEDPGVLDRVLEEIEYAEQELEERLETELHPVASPGKRGRVKGRGVQRNFRAKRPKKSGKPRTKRYTLDEARDKFDGFDRALKAYRKFHDSEPSHVDVYELDDGQDEVTLDRVHTALHRTLETNYLVPWESNKKGSLWKHEHIEGALDGKINLESRVEDLPLEIYDDVTKTTRKLPNGRWYVSDWWRERGGRGEGRVH